MSLYSIRPFDRAIDAASFCCGQPILDEYIRCYASQDIRRNVARVFLATPEHDSHQLAGFYSLSAGSISCSDLPASLAKRLPNYPVPVALIGRLAVAAEFQGKGLGSILLADACQKVAQASVALAVVGIVVEAKDAAVETFYKQFGFMALPGNPNRLLLPRTAFLGCQNSLG